jgi:cyclase
LAIIRTRVADNTWVFTSELYLEVNAGLIVTPEGGVLVDTLPFPSETRQIMAFARRMCPQGIRYVVNTLAHADHVYGSYLFPEAELIAHEKCRDMLSEYAHEALVEAQEHTPELREVEIRLPRIVFNEGMLIRLGGKTIHIFNTPGPSPEVCCVHVREEKVLFASDLIMAVPLISGPFSDIDAYKQSLANLHEHNLECIVQGHGEVLLRGEITSSIDSSIEYIDDIQKTVDNLLDQGATKHDLLRSDVEDFDRSRIPLGGAVQQFHQSNLLYLWEKARRSRREARQAV